MKHLTKTLIFGCMAIILVTTACSDNSDIDTPIPQKEYPRTVTLTITSEYVFDNYSYPVKVYLPATYKTNKNLPVIYVLDGEVNLEVAISALGSNIEAIVVGIGDFAANEQWERRTVDFMPATMGLNCFGTEGKYLDFYNFISKELVPKIDFSYGNDHNSRTFLGHSQAGVFTFVSMFLEDPENVLFHNFMAIDPTLNCGPDYFAEMLHDYNFPEGAKTFKFYLASTFSGSTKANRQSAENVQTKEYSWLTFKFEEFLNESHMSVRDPSFKSGFNFIFE